MCRGRKFFCLLALLSVLLLGAQVSWAADNVDLSKTRIGRISFLEGEANIQHSGDTEWDSALVNIPVAVGDLIYTGSNARMELQLNGAFIRLNERTSLEAVELSPQRYRFDLTAGTVTFSLVQEFFKEVEIDTPQAAVTLKKAGVYRVNVLANGDTEVVVHKGEAELFSHSGQFKLHDGRRATFRADSQSDVEIVPDLLVDAWDSWNEGRDKQARINRNSYAYVPSTVYGVSDLDLYGSWANVPLYGWVWRPTGIGLGWAPYRLGRWSYYQPFGWTWISFEPWGWVPYHYGYWTYLPEFGEWVWVPYDVGWFWSPAFVSWYYVSWNNINYVAWRPRPIPQPAPQPAPPITSGPPGQPIKHNTGEGSNGVGGRPPKEVLVHSELANGLTFLDEKGFAGGGVPQPPTSGLLEQVQKARPIQHGAIPVKPTRSDQSVEGQGPRQLPPAEIISRPVIAHSSKLPQKSGLQPRREHEVLGAPGVVSNSDTTQTSGGKRGQRATSTGSQAGHQKLTPAPSHSQQSSPGGGMKAGHAGGRH